MSALLKGKVTKGINVVGKVEYLKPDDTPLVIKPGNEEQEYSGVFGTIVVEPMDITVSPNYNNALDLSNEILGN